jgi:hypothetical protein
MMRVRLPPKRSGSRRLVLRPPEDPARERGRLWRGRWRGNLPGAALTF